MDILGLSDPLRNIFLLKTHPFRNIFLTQTHPLRNIWSSKIHPCFIIIPVPPNIKYLPGSFMRHTTHNTLANETQYDWFPGKSQNSKKFSAKFKQNPTTSKNHRVFLNILGWVKIPPRRSQQILGVKITSKVNSQHRRNNKAPNCKNSN